jgi:acetolactate synthase small subunit
MLSALAGVEALSTEEMTTDHTTLVVTYQGDARGLADALMLNTFDAFGVRIYDVSENSMQVELIPQ